MTRLEKTVDSTSDKKKGKRQCSEERGVKIKQRRSEMYREMSADRRELNLMQRRMAYLHSTTQNPIGNSAELPTSSHLNGELIENRIGVRGATSSLLETTVSDNGRVIGGSSCVFEVGTYNEQYNITSRTATKKEPKDLNMNH
nr:uncharacterized protein LOC104091681 isoform X2 [Nicotiana tomentosiformis]